MPSRFNQIIEPTPYVSSYVPLPLELMANVLGNKQKQYEGALDEIKSTQDLIKINADPKHKEQANRLRSAYNNQITQLADEIVKTGDVQGVESKTRELKRQFSNDPNRLQLESNFENYKKYAEDAVKNKDKYWENYDPYSKLNVQPEQVTPFNYTGMKTKGDYVPQMQSLIDGLKADKTASGGYKKDKSGNFIINALGQIQKNDRSYEAITESKVWQKAKQLAPTFFRTKDAQWYIDEHAGAEYKSYDQLSPKEKEYFENKAAQDMFNIGSTQTFESSSSGVNLQNISEGAYKDLHPETTDPWSTFTPQIPGDKTDKAKMLSDKLPVNLKDHMMYDSEGKLVSKQDNKPGFWSSIADIAKFIASPGTSVVMSKAKALVQVKDAVEAYKDVKPLLLNYGVASGMIKNESELNAPGMFKKVKEAYGNVLADAIISNREVQFDETTSNNATKAILPTLTKDGKIFEPNLMGSTSVYNLDGSIVPDNTITAGGKILGPDSKNDGRLLVAARDGKQYSIDPNIPDLKLVTKKINDFDKGVIDKIATSSVTNDMNSTNTFMNIVNSEIDKYGLDEESSNMYKSNYMNNIQSLVDQGYRMTAVKYDGMDVPVGIRYNPDGTTDKMIIDHVPGVGLKTMEIGEYKRLKTQESFIKSGILPAYYDQSNKQYQANTIRPVN